MSESARAPSTPREHPHTDKDDNVALRASASASDLTPESFKWKSEKSKEKIERELDFKAFIAKETDSNLFVVRKMDFDVKKSFLVWNPVDFADISYSLPGARSVKSTIPRALGA